MHSTYISLLFLTFKNLPTLSSNFWTEFLSIIILFQEDFTGRKYVILNWRFQLISQQCNCSCNNWMNILLLYIIVIYYRYILLLYIIVIYYCYILSLYIIVIYYCYILLLYIIVIYYRYILLLYIINHLNFRICNGRLLL